MITQQRLKELFEYNPDTGLFIRKIRVGNQIAGNIAGSLKKDGYVYIKIDSKPYKAHRLAFLYMEGYMPEEVDHINRECSDNRWCNLRASNRQENNRNRKSWSKSGYLGVYWNKNTQKWQVKVKDKNSTFVFGGLFNYSDLLLAVETANNLRAELHGKTAVIEVFDPNRQMLTLQELNE